MILDPNSMPPLVREFAMALHCSPNDQVWLRQYGHEWIDSLFEPDGSSAAMAQEILRLMRENPLGQNCWGSLIWDHDLVPKVIEATGLSGEAREQLELVARGGSAGSFLNGLGESQQPAVKNFKARQSYEQQSGLATFALGAAFWEVRSIKG